MKYPKFPNIGFRGFLSYIAISDGERMPNKEEGILKQQRLNLIATISTQDSLQMTTRKSWKSVPYMLLAVHLYHSTMFSSACIRIILVTVDTCRTEFNTTSIVESHLEVQKNTVRTILGLSKTVFDLLSRFVQC